MATVVYRDAVVMVDGTEISASLNEAAMELSAEILDETCFGDHTRIHKGGLLVARLQAKGFAEFGSALIEPVIFNDIGVDDQIVAVFPEGVIEGSLTVGTGFAMKGTATEFQLGGQVGALLPLSFVFEGRGVN